MKSNRMYTVITCINRKVTVDEGVDLPCITHPGESPFEWQPKAAEVIDEILDLKPGQCMTFVPMDGVYSAAGIILRTN